METKIFDLKKDTKRILVIILAALLMAVNIKTFVQAGNLLPGGATGLTLLIQRAVKLFFDLDIPYSPINILLNAIPAFIGFKFIGKKFTIYSCLMIFLVGLFADLIPAYTITDDVLLVSIFGGIINGAAISICLSVEATSGGTDFIAIYMSEKKHMDSWNFVLGINAVILSVAGLLFGWDKALYSIIFQYASTQMIHLLFQHYQKETLLVVTKHPELVSEIIHAKSHHGATIIKAEGSYEHKETFIVYSVIGKDQYISIVSIIKQEDPDAFINTIDTESLTGRFFHKKTE
ncbi:MAG: YitT family protein [Paludibacteraceae bacterium]|nr:YitT family protein [Paludibacteraceae bacterium]MBQ8020662.1 YitT family protein [Paludibacteraceae bacterium]MBR6112561.1 YitT family protein [Paludibacteraceae bacterium]